LYTQSCPRRYHCAFTMINEAAFISGSD
jgi:hypothetical protein